MLLKSGLQGILLNLNLVVSLIALVASSGLLRAQQNTSERLREQAAKLEQDIDALKKSKSDLGGRVSASLLSAIDSEIKAKQVSLASAQVKIKQAEALQQDLVDLTSLRDKMQDRVSAQLASKLNEEIASKQQALANLSDAEATAGVVPAPNQDATHSLPGVRSAPATSDLPAPPGPKPAASAATGATPAKPAVLDASTAEPVAVDLSESKRSEAGQKVPEGRQGKQSQPGQQPPSGRREGAVTRGGAGTGTASDKGGQSNDNTNDNQSSDLVNTHRRGSWERAVIGFQQSGASAAQSTQRFFFDVFRNWPIHECKAADQAKDKKSGTTGKTDDGTTTDDSPFKLCRVSWWGNVRVASYPQQISTPVAQFASNFATEVGNLQVNQLVQSAQYTTGLEWTLKRGSSPVASHTEDLLNTFDYGLIVGGGAIGPVQPKETLQIFAVPPTGSPQEARFYSTFPAAKGAAYVGFVSPDRDRFFRRYEVGIRATKFFFDNQQKEILGPPATVSVTFGQDESVTGGRLHGVVGRIEAFYPLSLGNRSKFCGSCIFLFGEAKMGLSRVNQVAPFILQPAPDTVHGYESNVAIFATPSNRDTYMIGAGIDAAKLLSSLKK